MFEQLFNELNLDGMSNDPADYDGAAQVLSTLSTYASMKAKAMRHRQAGEIDRALNCERILDTIYKALPEWARW